MYELINVKNVDVIFGHVYSWSEYYQMQCSKVGSTYWGKFDQGSIQILPIWDTTCATGYGIWDNFNSPMLIPHKHICKYGPHL